MKLYGLIGFPLSHSFSKKYFTEKFEKEQIPDSVYENFPIRQIEDFPAVVSENQSLIGLNVTIPYKEKVIPYLDQLEATAAKIGAVNTIKISRSENSIFLQGFNTDIYGFENSLKPHLSPTHKKALILGTGGASKAIAYTFEQLGIAYTYVSRAPEHSGQLSYDQLNVEIITQNQIIVNASPLGTYPDVDNYPPIPYNGITSEHILYDLVYNPPLTRFLAFGKERGAKIINGQEMLVLQAEKSWKIWNS